MSWKGLVVCVLIMGFDFGLVEDWRAVHVGELDWSEIAIQVKSNLNAQMRAKTDLNESEIDLNESEHFLRVNSMYRSEIDRSWIRIFV